MSSRESILARVKEALSTPTIRPDEHGAALDSSYAEQEVDHEPRTHWMRDPGETLEENLALFRELSEKLRTEVHEVATMEEAARLFADLVKTEGWERIATHSGALTDELRSAVPGGEWLQTDGGYDIQTLEACQAGLSECIALVAQTGSLLVTSQSSGGRALSVLPPHHIVIARRSQVVPDLTSAYARLKETYPDGYPSLITFITGPSRTGDIERTLVLGAHGPKRLSVILVET